MGMRRVQFVVWSTLYRRHTMMTRPIGSARLVVSSMHFAGDLIVWLGLTSLPLLVQTG